MLFSGFNSRLINPFDGASGESLPDQNNGTSTWSRTNSKLAGKILADCNKSLKHPKIRKHPSASAPLPPGRCRSLTAGVDAGVADRFVFVAGRVFLQFTQDLLHGRLQASGRSGCVCACWSVVILRIRRQWQHPRTPRDEGDDSFPQTGQWCQAPAVNPGENRKLLFG